MNFHHFGPLKILPGPFSPPEASLIWGTSAGDGAICTVPLLGGTEVRRWELTRWK